jgi:hypothetical protein
LKLITLVSFVVLILNSAFAAELPSCVDRRGNTLNGSIEQLKQVMNSRADRPQILVNGVVEKMLPEDKAGNPHQKYILNVSGLKIQVVSNLEFGRVPVAIGSAVQVCGEFLRVGAGMVHWTHFDPHGGHPNGFSIMNGKLYGDVETPL